MSDAMQVPDDLEQEVGSLSDLSYDKLKIRSCGAETVTGAPATSQPASTGHLPSTSDDVPGGSHSMMESVTLGVSGLVESYKPLKKICEHVCAFHWYAQDMSRQVVAHHYCRHLNAEVRQCILYDTDQPDARLIGVEYMISKRLFEALPEEEKKYWHSHRYEVESGQLYSPNLPVSAQLPAMQAILDNAMYGKTWHFWQIDRGDELPFGPPQLMMSATADGQLNADMVKARDEALGCSTEKHKAARQGLKYPPVAEISTEADHWQHGDGNVWQVSMEKVTLQRRQDKTEQ